MGHSIALTLGYITPVLESLLQTIRYTYLMANIQLKLHPLWGCRTSIIPTYDPIINKKGHPLRAKQAPTMHLTNPLPLLFYGDHE